MCSYIQVSRVKDDISTVSKKQKEENQGVSYMWSFVREEIF